MAAIISGSKHAQSCCCVGPQNGEPLCPCRMRNVEIRNGRYVETIDHGPVTEPARLAGLRFEAFIDAMQRAEEG